MSVRLYVGNLPKELERQELVALFAESDDSVTTKVITDRKTGKCRGFGFVTVKNDEEADKFIEKYNGVEFKDSVLKIEKAMPRTKGKGDEEGDAADAPASAPSGNSKARKGGNNKPKRSTSSEPESVQPDPRWAQELEKLKQLLATQTANS